MIASDMEQAVVILLGVSVRLCEAGQAKEAQTILGALDRLTKAEDSVNKYLDEVKSGRIQREDWH